MFTRQFDRRRAFTLIELLVVVAIIATLIAILLPSLSRAREQARIARCTANIRSIGQAMCMYFGEWANWFPFARSNWPSAATPLHPFYYGGHPGRPGWGGYDDSALRDTPLSRPFNRYLYPDLSGSCDDPAQAGEPDFERRRDLPIFACPSDAGGITRGQTDDQIVGPPAYFRFGSSYDMNYHFVWHWAAASDAADPQRYVERPAELRAVYLQAANRFLARQLAGHASRFVILFEDPFDSAQWNNVARVGWHGQLNRHTFLFLDAHAAHTLADATQGNSGPGWKTSAGAWFYDPTDPDYPYRDLGP
ncbi:MAG: prepilin-type N-terminal cleavage/methylation domain-containing protein [Planctomycetes bacterium]|nr:prepilin-type N-terminal cleavage/methylation domain-containing protein [Planctomycetota bacterium]